jgi:hypothetical protein
MSGEVSYFSRFLVKFVEIIAAGLASAISGYLLAHFGGVLLSYPTPASAPVTPTASLLADSVRAAETPNEIHDDEATLSASGAFARHCQIV